MINMSKTIKGLRHCINANNDGCDDCPYYGSGTEQIGCQSLMQSDALALFECILGEDMDKMRIENAELIQRIQQLEKELEKEKAYNYAIVTVIKKTYPT